MDSFDIKKILKIDDLVNTEALDWFNSESLLPGILYGSALCRTLGIPSRQFRMDLALEWNNPHKMKLRCSFETWIYITLDAARYILPLT